MSWLMLHATVAIDASHSLMKLTTINYSWLNNAYYNIFFNVICVMGLAGSLGSVVFEG